MEQFLPRKESGAGFIKKKKGKRRYIIYTGRQLQYKTLEIL
jgi:hypothetical protein